MLTLQIAREFALEITIGLLGIQIQYGNGTKTVRSEPRFIFHDSKGYKLG